MQLYALANKSYIVAAEAERHKNYCCPECLGALRVRGGPHRQTHFYHLQSTSACRLAKKTLTHLQVQFTLSKHLPGSTLEKHFPHMGRIADLVWEKEKLIIEVQCSPISLEEASSRCKDYRDLGYRLVWVLHDRRFNQRRLSAAETFLRKTPCYFTNITEEAQGTIYDQFEIIKQGRRCFKGPPLNVDLSKPYPFPSSLESLAPLAIRQRSALYFQGDLTDHFQKKPTTHSMAALERRFLYEPPKKRSLIDYLKKTYEITLHALLEIAQK